MPRLVALSLIAGLFAVRASAEAPLDFDRDVRPILEQHCFKCHGPDKQKAGLRLDRKPSALKGGDSGEPAVVPGNLVKSHLLKLVTSDDPELAMPPKGERLKPAEVAKLQKWVETGAHWVDKPVAAEPLIAVNPDAQITEKDRAFWSFVPPRMSEPGAIRDESWPRTRIDRFILARLEARGLKPTAEASREILIRRLTFDLTGLPPTPADVGAFLADRSPEAYEKVVDRLLASPAFGERMASVWLPLARYAEDQAHQVGSDTKFFYPNAFKYRQWVIEAFNRDLSYDRFVRFQIAADKDAEASPADQAALGFLGLGPKYYNRDRLSVQADEWEDRVDTVTRTTLGLTVACARCHDHKFDPISQRDYYALAGVFASTKLVNKTPDGKVQKGEADAAKVDAAAVHVVEDLGAPKDLNLFIRGNVDRKGPVVPRHFLSILSEGTPTPFKDGSGRLELARAIADRQNPLTARVMVNRLWGVVFGQPIVLTPSNFGHSGQPPSNQPLLDDLAVRFRDGGWSVKAIMREMVLSATYRQGAKVDPAAVKVDPSNESLWRMNRRRMTVEQWRDAMLFTSGALDASGGKSLELSDPANLRRTVYARISRLQLNDLLMQFDYPDANVHAERRSVTNTPMQKLFVLNSDFVLARAKQLAARVAAEVPKADEKRITAMYRRLYARPPSASEMRLGVEFLQEAQGPGMTRWEEYAQALLASNEAMYID
jgi:mono/diheme cytochrome c family protein